MVTKVVRKRKDGTHKEVWAIDLSYGEDQRLRRDSKGTTKAAALAEEKRYLDNIAKFGTPDEPQAPEVLSFSELVQEWQKHPTWQELKISTRKSYTNTLERYILPTMAKKPITTISGKDFHQLWSSTSHLAKTTIRNGQIVFRAAMRFAYDLDLIPAMPTKLPKLGTYKQTVEVIPSVEQVAQLIANAPTRHQQLAFGMVAYAGLRPSEVRALTWSDVGERFLTITKGKNWGEVTTPKTGTGRQIPISAELRALLPVRREPHQEVCLSHRNQPWGQSGLTQAFSRLIDKLGMDQRFTLYNLRAVALSYWNRLALSPVAIMKMAGHSQISTTQIYLHMSDAELEAAAVKMGALAAI